MNIQGCLAKTCSATRNLFHPPSDPNAKNAKNLKIKKANYFAFIIMKIQSKQVDKELQMNVQ